MKNQFQKFVLSAFVVSFLIFYYTFTATAQQSISDVANFEEIKAKAENGELRAQFQLGNCYFLGHGVNKDLVQAAKWYLEAAMQGLPEAQVKVSWMYESGNGMLKDDAESLKWLRMAVDQSDAAAQYLLANRYSNGEGLPKDCDMAVNLYRKAADQDYIGAIKCLELIYRYDEIPPGDCRDMGVKNLSEAAKWYRKAAELGDFDSQMWFGDLCLSGEGVPKDEVEAYKWYLLVWSRKDDAFNFFFDGDEAKFKSKMDALEQTLTPTQRAEGQRRANEFKPLTKGEKQSYNLNLPIAAEIPKATGTAFFITSDGYLISNFHVVKDAAKIRLLTGAGLIDANVVKSDAANDLALLKASGQFVPLPVAASRGIRLGSTVATVGFPDIGLQGFSPKLAKGEIASLSGAADDPRYFQISVPVQPGNSGGALVDEHGNVVGIVAAKLDAKTALDATGALPENVNYAVKSSLLLSFLESVPDVDAKLKDPNTKDEPFEDVVKSAQDAAVLVLVY